MFYVPSPSLDNAVENGKTSEDISENREEEVKTETMSYETELKLLWDRDLKFIRNHVLLGNLRTSKIRSLYWRVLLDVIPSAPREWLGSIRKLREKYDDIRKRFTLDPHTMSGVPDDNPLSQDENSVWYRYFCDTELKRLIQQDVVRTSPEKQFFQLSNVQEIMTNILFIYARQNPDICYRQGMHEILASILYVIHEDCLNFKQISEHISVMNSDMSEILDIQFLEKDAYCLFSCIMQRMEAFYHSNNNIPNACGHFPAAVDLAQTTAGSDTEDESGIGFHLTVIKSELPMCDWALYKHLETLNIPFTAFGIRWLRLLFGREFPFADLLVLWDAIFAFDSDFVLVKYILIAMLVAIRDKLLNSDYMECLNYLMKYPDTVDVIFVIRYALYIKDARTYAAPTLPKVSKTEPESVAASRDDNRSLSNRSHAAKPSANAKKERNNVKSHSTKKTTGDQKLLLHSSSSKSADMITSEIKHMRVVMSLCKLKLYQYHDILSTAVDPEDINAQHALTGIHELCSLLDVDYFSLKSSPNTPPVVEKACEADEVPIAYSQASKDLSNLHPSVDAVAMYLPPPHSEVDMTVFKRTESATVDMSKFPRTNPHKPDECG